MNRLLWPLSTGFRAGIELRRAAYRHGLFKTHRLNRPVVSVGNLSVGGTGKTPLVMYIAEKLLERGWRPSILTRGYKRRIGGMVALAPEAERVVDPREVGDEPAWLAQALPQVPIIISANRYRAGRMAEDRFAVDVHLLDDGFQHWSLARDLDIVTLDVTEELSEGALLPEGRLREPCSALARADVIVLTRTELADPAPHRETIARINPRANVFQSSLTLHSLVDVQNGSRPPLDEVRGHRALAFCGIGNSRAFFADLRRWGVEVVKQVVYRDHYAYGDGELRRLAARARDTHAEILVTTEKDLMNFPPAWKPEMPVIACAVRLEIQEAQAFEEAIIRRLRMVRVPG